METATPLSNNLQTILLFCGVVASVLYFVTDRIAGALLKGYSFSANSMDELSAAGSPTRSLVLSLTLLACLFMVAFGAGVWPSAGENLFLSVVGWLIIANAVLGLVAHIFFPNRYGERPPFNSPGVILMFASVVCFILAMIFSTVAFGGWFGLFSIAIPILFVLLAVLRFATAKASSAGEGRTLIGSQERTMAYSYLLWILALSIYLMPLS